MTPSARQRLVEQRLLRRQDRLQADPRLGAEAHPLVARPGGDRGGRLDERLGLRPHARLVVAAGDDGLRRGRRVDAGRVGPQERVLERRPLVQPLAVAGTEDALRRPPVEVPQAVARVHRGDPLPPHRVHVDDGLGERRLDVLADAGALDDVEPGARRRRRQQRGAEAGPRHGEEDRAFPAAELVGAGGHVEAGLGEVDAHDVVHPGAVPAALVGLQPGAGRDQPLDVGPVGRRGVAAVGGDRRVHEAGVDGAQVVVLEAERDGDRPGGTTPARRRRAPPGRAPRPRPSGAPRSSTTRRVPRCHTTSPGRSGPRSGASTRTTSAPWSDSSIAVIGPAMPVLRSSTRTPSRIAGHPTSTSICPPCPRAARRGVRSHPAPAPPSRGPRRGRCVRRRRRRAARPAPAAAHRRAGTTPSAAAGPGGPPPTTASRCARRAEAGRAPASPATRRRTRGPAPARRRRGRRR